MSIDQLRRDLLIQTEIAGHPLQLQTTWGLFSPRAIDEGSRLLLDHLHVEKADIALDIGCGYGPLGLSIAQRAPDGQVHLVDKDFLAIEYSRANAARNGITNAECYLSNGLSHVAKSQSFSLIVSNLPAKVGNELLQIFFHDARAHMQPGSRLVVVTINGLRDFIKRSFRETFGNYHKVKQGRRYTISMAESAR